jgi:hypothetical protein
MITTIDNPEPEKQTVRVKLRRAIFVRGQGAKKPGDVIELDSEEFAHLRYYDLFELVPADEPAMQAE